MSVFPPFGGGTLRILQASSNVSPEEAKEAAPPGLFFALAAYFCDADACLYASANARPTTRAPVKTTCVIIRCAMMWEVDVEFATE